MCSTFQSCDGILKVEEKYISTNKSDKEYDMKTKVDERRRISLEKCDTYADTWIDFLLDFWNCCSWSSLVTAISIE